MNQLEKFRALPGMDKFKHLRQLQGYSALSTEGIEYIERVFASEPARAVGQTSLLSVSGSYASAKFPHLTDYESAGCEKPYVLLAILNGEIVDILAQPAALRIVTHDKRGRRKPRKYVADYIEFGKNCFSIVEAKEQWEMEDLARKTSDWQKDNAGNWRFLPGIAIAERYGMGFRVFCPDKFTKVYLSNLQIVARLPGSDLLRDRAPLIAKIRRVLADRPRTILELCRSFNEVTGALIYQAIAKGKLFGLLDHQHLDNDFVVYATAEEMAGHLSETDKRAFPKEQVGPLLQRLLTSSKRELEIAVAAQKRYDERRSLSLKRNATDYRDQKQLALAQIEAAPRLAGFVRRVGDRGGNGNAIPPTVSDEIQFHAERWLRKGGVTKVSHMYADFVIHAEEKGLDCPCLETYRTVYLKTIAPERAAFLAGGKRAFHAARPRTGGDVANARLRIAGLHVHVDGVFGDVRSKPDPEALFLRPIYFPLMDDVTGYVLGRGVKVGRPSSIAVAMAHRDCYIRHGFLPSQIYSDWGTEFVNHFIPEMSAYFGVGYERRPAGASRFGGAGEMLNAQFSSFLQELAGGTYFDKAGRSADGKKKSRCTAALDIGQIILEADKWLFEIWNKTPVGSNDKTPEELWRESMLCFPEAVVPVSDDPLARYYTSLPINAAKFSYVRGLSYGGVRFSSSLLADLIRRGEKPSAPRLDCMDPSTIHVQTEEGPIALHSMQYQRVQGMPVWQKLAYMRNLFSARSRASSNQLQRNVAQARQLREMEHVASSVAVEPAKPKPIDSFEIKNPKLDFSKALTGSRELLPRLGSSGVESE